MKIKSVSLAALASMAMAASSAHAATIAWSSTAFLTDNTSPWALGTGQFTTTGTQILAENSGGGAVLFDTINFTAPSINFDASFNGFYDSGSPLAAEGTYMNANAAGIVNLIGLTSGYTYRIQALVIDGRTEYNGRTVWFDGTNQGVYANGVSGDYGDGILVTGTFVADGTTQSFTIDTKKALSEPLPGSPSGGQLNALTLYQTAIPEPSAALLSGLGMLALLRRRR